MRIEQDEEHRTTCFSLNHLTAGIRYVHLSGYKYRQVLFLYKYRAHSKKDQIQVNTWNPNSATSILKFEVLGFNHL